jgi:hypothetical protein
METTLSVKDLNELKCIMCNDFHKRPTNGSFPINEILLGLMNEKPKEVYRSEEVENLKLNLNKLEALSNTFQFNLNNSEFKIKEHCIELRRLSQLSTEQKKVELDQFNDDFIKQINQYESNCIRNLKDKQYKQFEQSINEIIIFNKEKRNYLKTYNINDKQIIDANKMATSYISKVNDQITNLDCYIFNSNKMEFITNKDKFDKKIVGSISFEKLISTTDLKVHKINFKNLQLETNEFFFDFLSNSENVMVYKANNNHKWIIAKLDLFSPNPKFNKNVYLDDLVPNSNIKNVLDLKTNKEKTKIVISKNNNYDNWDNLMILDENLELIWNFSKSDLRGSLNTYSNTSDIFNEFDSNSWLIFIRYNNQYCIFDLHSLKIHQVSLNYNYIKNQPYFIDQNVTEILKVNDKIIWYNENQINILNMKDGCLIKSINENKGIQKIEVSTDDKLVVLINVTQQSQKLKVNVYDLNGNMNKEYEIELPTENPKSILKKSQIKNIKKSNKFLLFKLDKNNIIHILDTSICLNIRPSIDDLDY